MARQCFDFIVRSDYAIPEDVLQSTVSNVVSRHKTFDLQYVASHTNYVYTMPVMVLGPFAICIGESMPILVQLFDRDSDVTPDSIKGTSYAANLAILAYELCQEIINELEEVIYQINKGRIKRDDIRYKVHIYLRIS